MRKIIICFSLIVIIYADNVQNARNEAYNFNSTYSNKFKDRNYINNALINPINGNGEIKTLDNSKSGEANILCSDNKNPFIKISYSGSSDIDLHIDIDSNKDGIFEKNYVYSGVSGVGTNGIAICSPNTFTGCNFYTFSMDNALNLSTTLSNRDDILGLYCINSSCNSLSQTNKTQILQDISSGIMQLFQSVRNSYIVSKIETTTDEIVIYGQENSNCSDRNTIYNGSNGIPSSSDLQNQATNAMANDDDGYFEVLDNSLNNKFKNTENEQNQFVNDIASNTKLEEASIDDTTKTINYSTKDGNNYSARVLYENNNSMVSCIVAWEEENNQIMPDGSRKGTSGGVSSTIKEEMRECTGTNNDVCPYDSSKGEYIKNDCGDNMSSIAESAGAFQALQEMSKDFTCSR